MIKIYNDEKADTLVESLDLGRVELGKTMKYTVFIKNTDTEWPVRNIKIENTNNELKFEAPETLEANEVKEVYVYWTPKLDSRRPLRTEFKFSGDTYIG